MRQFFKFLFASCLGTTIALFLLFFILLSIGASFASEGNSKATESISANSVLHLKFEEAIPELTDNVKEAKFEFDPQKTLGSHDIIAAIKYAKTDDDVKGIFIEADQIQAGFTTIASIRNAIDDFKASGKFVYSYAPYYTQGAYYLASAGNKVALAPLGIVDWRGFASTRMFFKDALERIGVHHEVFYAGKFKSASEPYRRNDMSENSKLQTHAFLDEMYRIMLEDVGNSRSITSAQLRDLADKYTGIDPQGALEGNLVDKLIYREAFLEEIREEIGLDSDEKIKFVKLSKYQAARVPFEEVYGEKIAILVAEGVIVDGKGEASKIGDKKYVKLIEKLRKDDDVKAIVLRVNSPGGSAMASDHIWQALMDLKATGKPVVASMGYLAASGGYYISCAADSIFAEPSTITGSIGVVSAIPQLQKMLNEKIGVHFDSVKTGPFAHGLNPVFNMTTGERLLLENRTNAMYQTFLSRVSEGRGIPIADVDSIAQGRVWVGTAAAEIGLVDRIGDLNDAIQTAADMAGLTDYKTQMYPKQASPWERLLKEIMDPEEMMRTALLKEQLGSLYPYYVQYKEVTDSKGLQMMLPIMIEF